VLSTLYDVCTTMTHFSVRISIVKEHMTVIVPIYKKREQDRGIERTAKKLMTCN